MKALLLALALNAVPAIGVEGDPQAQTVWARRFASPGDDWVNDIVPLGGGRYLAVGFLNRSDGDASDWRALAATLGKDGEVHAVREYGAGRGIDAFWSAAAAGDGGLVHAGFTTRIGAGGIDALALFTDTAGTLRREAAFGGAGYDRFTGLAPAGGGYVFIGHSQRPGEARRRLLAVRTDADGGLVWERIIEGPESISPLYIEAAADGGFVVAGGIAGDMLVMKVDRAGRELWRRRVGTPEADDVNHGLALLPGGNIVVVGYSRSWHARGNDILAATLSPTGEILQQAMFGGAEDDRPSLAKADAQGRVWIVGTTRSAGAGGSDALVVRLDAHGAFEPGALVIGSAGDDHGSAIRPLADGALIVAFHSDGLGSAGEDAFVQRISAPTFARAHPAFTVQTIP